MAILEGDGPWRRSSFAMAGRAELLRQLCTDEWGTTDERTVDAVLGGAVAVQALLGVFAGAVEGVTPADVLHAEQHVRLVHRHDWDAPVVADATLDEVVRYGIGAAVEATCTLTSADGAARQRHSSIVTLPPTVDAADAVRRPRTTPPGRVAALGSARWTPTDAFPARYAAVSGDENPIHLDADAAREVGLPGVILHGMSVLAFAVHTAAGHAGDRRVSGLGTRFSRPVRPGAEVVAEVWSTEDPATLRVQVSTPDGPALRDCYLTVEEDPAGAGG